MERDIQNLLCSRRLKEKRRRGVKRVANDRQKWRNLVVPTGTGRTKLSLGK